VIDFVRNTRDILHFLVYRATDEEHFSEVLPYLPYFTKVYIPHTREEFRNIIPEELWQDIEYIFEFVG